MSVPLPVFSARCIVYIPSIDSISGVKFARSPSILACSSIGASNPMGEPVLGAKANLSYGLGLLVLGQREFCRRVCSPPLVGRLAGVENFWLVALSSCFPLAFWGSEEAFPLGWFYSMGISRELLL